MYSVACIGVGGYARHYVDAMARLSAEGSVCVRALADPDIGAHRDALRGLLDDVPRLYTDYSRMLETERGLDIVTIGTPLHLHAPMVIDAVESGCHVILAKPSAVTVQSLDAMISAARAARRSVMVDFQHARCGASLKMKEILSRNTLGRVTDIFVKAIWRRDREYYRRNSWAGRMMRGREYVLDGPMNNPHAHYLFNTLYFARSEPDRFAVPVGIRAELYHAKEIEVEDTACIATRTDTGVDIHIYSTLCGLEEDASPEIVVVGERGTALWRWEECIVRVEGRREERHTFPVGDTRDTVRDFVAALNRGGGISRTLENTRGHVLMTNGAYESSRKIVEVREPHRIVESRNGAEYVGIADIESIIDRAIREKALFSDLGVPWSRKTEYVSLDRYTRFGRFQ